MKKRKALIKTAAVLTATTMLGISSVYPSVNILPGRLIQVQAANIVMEGDCGKVKGTVTYKLDSDGVLTISGSGEMKDYNYNIFANNDEAPWDGNRDSVKKVVIEDGVTSIGDSAFYVCSGLSSIEIPGSVTSIGDSAFYRCSGLSSIEIPGSVTSIGWGAFQCCSGLSSIEIPGSVTSIGRSAFDDCSGLSSIEIPGSVTSIGDGAFRDCSGLSSIEIPGSVTSIGNFAFSGCSGLSSIEIPGSVTSIKSDAFSSCSGLSSIVVEEGNEVYDSRENCNAIISKKDNMLIAGCKNTKIPESVASIGRGAFEGCRGLSNIEIPGSVTSIGMGAFYGCSGLSSIEIPGSVTSIESGVFGGCSGLSSIEIPGSVKFIGADAFEGCSGLSSIEIPGSVTSIGYDAFKGCSGLSNIEIPGSVTSICDGAFAYCSGLSSIEIPESVTRIDVGTFAYCSGLSSIVVEEGNEVYDSRENCNAIICKENNELIAGCKNTKIPESVTSIVAFAFSGRSGLSSIEIPGSVTRIGEGAFDRCSKDLRIVGETGSYAEEYANKYNIQFVDKNHEHVIEIPTEGNVWHTDDLGNTYWYEDGVKQGVKYNEDGTVDLAYRGKEIYDPQTDAWYWLDSVLEGQIAKSKDVYQESKAGIFGDNKVYKEDGTIDVDANTGKWVRYDKDGHMVKGWCQGKAEETTQIGSPSEAQQGQPVYYFDKTYGAMAKGYATIDGKEYYFNPDTGILEREVAGGVTADYTGWKDVDGVSYWYENGIRQGYSTDANYRGKEVYDPASNAWYWLDNIDGGKKAVNKDVYQESKADDAGNIGKWVRYDSEGHMVKGWSDDGRYYFDPVYGTMYKGWHNIDGTDYYFDEATGVRA